MIGTLSFATFPARDAARSDAPQTRGPGLHKATGVPGLQRITEWVLRCARDTRDVK